MNKQKIWRCPWHFLAFGFGFGLIKPAPGTWGTLPGVLIFLLLAKFSFATYLVVSVCFALFGFWLCDKVSKSLGVHDHPGIVWDEITGFLFTMIAMPISTLSVIAGFIFFRLFDITKPWPIKWCDKKVKGGIGIMLDDLLAAIPAWFCLKLLLFFS